MNFDKLKFWKSTEKGDLNSKSIEKKIDGIDSKEELVDLVENLALSAYDAGEGISSLNNQEDDDERMWKLLMLNTFIVFIVLLIQLKPYLTAFS